jgi:hypothetical protein
LEAQEFRLGSLGIQDKTQYDRFFRSSRKNNRTTTLDFQKLENFVANGP